MAAAPFPLWLILPAVAIDLLQHASLGFSRGWRRDLLLAGLVGAAFLLLFLPVQWRFASFYITPASGNWFFAGDRIFSYSFNRPDDRYQFWTDQDGWSTFSVLTSLAAASISALVGCGLGNLAAKVKR